MGSPYEKKYIELTEEDRAKVTSVYHNWQQEEYEETYENVPEFCYSASFEEVKEKGFTLVPSRYIEYPNGNADVCGIEKVSRKYNNRFYQMIFYKLLSDFQLCTVIG